MKLTVGELRALLSTGIEEAKVGASPEYMKKEWVRQALQDVITQQVAAGELPDAAALRSFFETADMALKALKMVPFDAWAKMAAPKD